MAINVAFLCVLVVISVIDMRRRKIPNIYCGLICVLKVAQWMMGEGDVMDGIKGVFAVGGIIFLTAITAKKGIGGGDIKLMMAGSFFLELERGMMAIFIGMGFAGLIGLAMSIMGMRTRKSTFVLGPFLSVGMVIGMLCGKQAWNLL